MFRCGSGSNTPGLSPLSASARSGWGGGPFPKVYAAPSAAGNSVDEGRARPGSGIPERSVAASSQAAAETNLSRATRSLTSARVTRGFEGGTPQLFILAEHPGPRPCASVSHSDQGGKRGGLLPTPD